MIFKQLIQIQNGVGTALFSCSVRAIYLLIIAVSVMPDQVLAADPTYSVTQSFALERGPVLREDPSAGQATELAFQLNLTTEAKWRKRRNNGHILSFSQSTEALGYFGDWDLNRLTLDAKAEYQLPLTEEKDWLLRFQSQFTHTQAPDGVVFQRARVGTMLLYKLQKGHTFRARLRFGLRDQNDARFAGFDQSEYLIEFGHDWRPAKTQPSFSTTVYADLRRAEASRFSYDELGLRFIGQFPLNEETKLKGRLGIYQREYLGPFSVSDSTFREDERYVLSAEIEHKISKNFTAFANIGWDSNNSLISKRKYSGFTAGVGVTVSLW